MNLSSEAHLNIQFFFYLWFFLHEIPIFPKEKKNKYMKQTTRDLIILCHSDCSGNGQQTDTLRLIITL